MGGISMAMRNSKSSSASIAKFAIAATALLGMLAMGGCSSSEPPPAQQAAMAKTELHFDLNKCESIEPGLYKCPASDRPMCNPDYNGQAECVRVGPKGSVFVQSGFAN
jgi:predicted component of type VI protein secretion system